MRADFFKAGFPGLLLLWREVGFVDGLLKLGNKAQGEVDSVPIPLDDVAISYGSIYGDALMRGRAQVFVERIAFINKSDTLRSKVCPVTEIHINVPKFVKYIYIANHYFFKVKSLLLAKVFEARLAIDSFFSIRIKEIVEDLMFDQVVLSHDGEL